MRVRSLFCGKSFSCSFWWEVQSRIGTDATMHDHIQKPLIYYVLEGSGSSGYGFFSEHGMRLTPITYENSEQTSLSPTPQDYHMRMTFTKKKKKTPTCPLGSRGLSRVYWDIPGSSFQLLWLLALTSAL